MKPEQEQLIRLYRTQGAMERACDIAGVATETHFMWLFTDVEYRIAHREATRFILERGK